MADLGKHARIDSSGARSLGSLAMSGPSSPAAAPARRPPRETSGPLSALLRALSNRQMRDRLIAACAEGVHETSPASEISRLSVALLLANTSGRTLEFQTARLRTAGDGGTHSHPADRNVSGFLATGRSAAITTHVALQAPLTEGRVLQATIEALVRYGAPGVMTHSLTLRYALTFKAASARRIEVFSWAAI